MLKLYNPENYITKAKLIISTGLVGFSSILACKLFIERHSFSKIGNYFSEYTEHTITKLPDEYIQQGDTYFNIDRNIVIIFFTAGPPSYYKKQFFKELNDFTTKNQITETLLVSGFLSEFQNDKEMRNPYVTPYYLSNNNNDSELKSAGVKSFAELCELTDKSEGNNNKLRKYKELDEVEYLTASGFSNSYLKYQKKTKGKYTYIGSYVRSPLDVESGVSLYLGLSNYLKFYVEGNINQNGILKSYSEKENDVHVIKVKKNLLNDALDLIIKLGIPEDWLKLIKST
jgi:hypothetical protein